MLKCDICNSEGLYKVRIEAGVAYCDKCSRPTKSRGGIYVGSESIRLPSGHYTTRAEMNENARGVCLPQPDGSWRLGRRDEDGKVREHTTYVNR